MNVTDMARTNVYSLSVRCDVVVVRAKKRVVIDTKNQNNVKQKDGVAVGPVACETTYSRCDKLASIRFRCVQFDRLDRLPIRGPASLKSK